MGSPELRSKILNLESKEGGISNFWGNSRFFNKCCWDSWVAVWQRIKLNVNPTPR